MTQEGDENDGTGDVTSGHQTENILAKSENEDKIPSLGETTDENMFIADIKVDDGSDLREGQVYYVKNKHGKVTEMIFTGGHLKEIKTEKEDFKQDIKTEIVENRTEANQNKCVLRNESSTDTMIQVKTEKCDNENRGILTAPVDTVKEAFENKSAIQNDNSVDNNLRVKTEKCEDENKEIQTKSVDNGTEGIQNRCTLPNERCVVKHTRIKTEKSKHVVKTELNSMDDVSNQNENWQAKEIKKERDDSHANSCVHNGSSTVDSKQNKTKSTNNDKTSEDIEPKKTLKGNNNASFVDIDRRNGETGRVRVKLEGGGEFEEGQIYVGRTRQGEIKQMAWKDGKLVELSSVPVTTGRRNEHRCEKPGLWGFDLV